MSKFPINQKNFSTSEEISESYTREDLDEKLSVATLDIFNVENNVNQSALMDNIQKAMDAAALRELQSKNILVDGISEEELDKLKADTDCASSLSNIPISAIGNALSKLREEFPDAPDVAIGRKFYERYIDSEATLDITNEQYLPMVLNREIMPNSIIQSKWNKLSDMPGHQLKIIRDMGRLVFDTYIKEAERQLRSRQSLSDKEGSEIIEKMRSGAEMFDTSEVITISNFTGADTKDMNSIAHWITTIGTPKVGFSDSPVEADYSDVMPGYKPKVLYYEMGNLDFKIVQDHMGQYIYAWENGTGGNKLTHQNDMEGTNIRALTRKNRP